RAGIERLVDVRTCDPARLQGAVGSLAPWLQMLARGEDPREVRPDRPVKSVSEESTYAEDLTETEAMRGEIDAMARRVAAALERRRLAARTVTIKARYADLTTVARSHTAPRPTRGPPRIAERALELLARTAADRRPVRLLGAAAHGLVPDGAEEAPADPVLPLAL